MNPVSNLLAVSDWQFLVIYSAMAFFAGLFAAHLRWEARAPDAPALELTPDERAELARGRTAERTPEAEARLRERGLLVATGAAARARGAIAAIALALAALGVVRMGRAQHVAGLAAAVAVTLAGGAAIAAAPFWLTVRGAEALEKA